MSLEPRNKIQQVTLLLLLMLIAGASICDMSHANRHDGRPILQHLSSDRVVALSNAENCCRRQRGQLGRSAARFWHVIKAHVSYVGYGGVR